MKRNTLFYKQYKKTASQMNFPDSLIMPMPTDVRISYHPCAKSLNPCDTEDSVRSSINRRSNVRIMCFPCYNKTMSPVPIAYPQWRQRMAGGREWAGTLAINDCSM